MAAKRGKKQARRKDEPRVSGVVWLLAGLLIGGAVAIALWLKNPQAVNDLLPHPNPTAKPRLASADGGKVPEGNPPASPASTASASSAAADGATTTPKKPRYDFYTLLPEREVVIPDDELSAQVKAEQSANLAAKQQAALAAASSTASTAGAATIGNPASAAGTAATTAAATNAATTNAANAATAANPAAAHAGNPAASAASATLAHTAGTGTATTATTAPATATVSANIPVPASQLKSGQYLLQAGAFRSTRQADDLKARIAMLGLVGRVETVQTPAGEMHRVRLGPYTTASELEAAKEKLGGSGLPAVAIRVK